jgi:hypothetical protein
MFEFSEAMNQAEKKFCIKCQTEVLASNYMIHEVRCRGQAQRLIPTQSPLTILNRKGKVKMRVLLQAYHGQKFLEALPDLYKVKPKV